MDLKNLNQEQRQGMKCATGSVREWNQQFKRRATFLKKDSARRDIIKFILLAIAVVEDSVPYLLLHTSSMFMEIFP